MTTRPALTSTREKPTDSSALLEELTKSLRETAESVVPWFVEHMPLMYFQDTDHETLLSHLRAICAEKASGQQIELTLRNDDGSVWTSMRPMDYPGVLAELVSELPLDRNLRAAKIHTASDGRLVIDTFEFGEAAPFDPNNPVHARKLQELIEDANAHGSDKTPEMCADHLSRCRAEYVETVTPYRMHANWDLCNEVSGTDGAAVNLEPEADPTQCRITLAIANVRTRRMLERLAMRLSHSSINIHRAYLDIIDDGKNGSITLFGFVVQGPDGGPIDPRGQLWAAVRRDLLRNKWLDDRTLAIAYAHPELGTVRAEVMQALCDLVHQVLVKINPYAFTSDRIRSAAMRNLQTAGAIVDLMLDRFNPSSPLPDAEFEKHVAAVRDTIENEVDLEDEQIVLASLVDAVCAVLRTNVYLDNRYGLSMRIDPVFLRTEDRPEVPFGVFFVHGRDFNGFHVRFRDIARGGVRAIRPIGADQHARESERLYDEAYNLAFAQQLKNKDIPEGGSKAAILVAAGERIDRSVKGFIDSLLDLITPDEATRAQIIDRFGQQELLYLGPDENITPGLIDWVVDRAVRRGYPTPSALMSSKPGAGINHKEYGVTSEGVNVFLEVALQSMGIDPTKRKFTVKITGGPDGDVAGNMIRILDRDYNGNACIVGIADGSGSGEDPDGLNLPELLRLVREELPIASFDRSKLGPSGRVVSLEEPDGVQLRNSMHNRVKADAFLPCGGRPAAVHEGNWRDFLDSDGKPTSPLIVEGANLFFTPEARISSSESGAVILKDSSANKCGVICSSFEIVACMLLSETEFLEIKTEFVSQVIVKLRDLARREAELLMRAHQQNPDLPLPEMSIRLSRVTIRVADAIEGAIDHLDEEAAARLRTMVTDHLPQILIDRVGERLWTDTPRPYLRWIMAKSLAARMVYREGFEHLESMPTDAIAKLAMEYLRLEIERRRLIGEVQVSSLENRDRIAELLGRAGILSTIQ